MWSFSNYHHLCIDIQRLFEYFQRKSRMAMPNSRLDNYILLWKIEFHNDSNSLSIFEHLIDDAILFFIIFPPKLPQYFHSCGDSNENRKGKAKKNLNRELFGILTHKNGYLRRDFHNDNAQFCLDFDCWRNSQDDLTFRFYILFRLPNKSSLSKLFLNIYSTPCFEPF